MNRPCVNIAHVLTRAAHEPPLRCDEFVGWYQVRKALEARNASGAAYDTLGDKLRPMVFELGVYAGVMLGLLVGAVREPPLCEYRACVYKGGSRTAPTQNMPKLILITLDVI